MAGRVVRALGLMSGTSVDGVDAAVLDTDGVGIHGFGKTVFQEYDPSARDLIRRGFGLWPGEDVELLGRIDQAVVRAHAEAAAQFQGVELIGFHGQTLNHAPDQGRTFQIGDGAALAGQTKTAVVWDFRSADVGSGGEGAPLVPVFHHALARHVSLEAPVVFLNIGGVANVTWVDPRKADPGERDALLAFDTGPGNALIDDLVQTRTGAKRDDDGALAAVGVADEALLRGWLADEYFSRSAPKSLDRNNFHAIIQDLSQHSTEDAVATLTAFTAGSIADAVKHMPEPPERWLVAGGGRHNASIMRALGALSNVPVEPVEAVGLDGDLLEAQAFAYLAVRVMRGLPTSFPSTTGVRLPVSGGKISDPATA